MYTDNTNMILFDLKMINYMEVAVFSIAIDYQYSHATVWEVNVTHTITCYQSLDLAYFFATILVSKMKSLLWKNRS